MNTKIIRYSNMNERTNKNHVFHMNERASKLMNCLWTVVRSFVRMILFFISFTKCRTLGTNIWSNSDQLAFYHIDSLKAYLRERDGIRWAKKKFWNQNTGRLNKCFGVWGPGSNIFAIAQAVFEMWQLLKFCKKPHTPALLSFLCGCFPIQ